MPDVTAVPFSTPPWQQPVVYPPYTPQYSAAPYGYPPPYYAPPPASAPSAAARPDPLQLLLSLAPLIVPQFGAAAGASKVLQYLPFVIQGVQVLRGQGGGEQKKALAMQLLGMVIQQIPDIRDDPEYQQDIAAFMDATVQHFNRRGNMPVGGLLAPPAAAVQPQP